MYWRSLILEWDIKDKGYSAGTWTAIEFRSGQKGTAVLFISVTAPNLSIFNYIRLRAEDKDRGAYVKAQLYRQPNCGGGAASKLGEVTTTDIRTPSDGFQRPISRFTEAVKLDYSQWSYYILVELYRTSARNIRAYDVSLHTQAPECPE